MGDAAVAARVRERAEERRLAGLSDEALLAGHGLPEPEVLETVEEVQAFLKAALPARLRNRALRRLWRLNPVLANLDGLVDHGEDYRDAAVSAGAVSSSYRVGQGMMRHIVHMAEQAERGQDAHATIEDVDFTAENEVSNTEVEYGEIVKTDALTVEENPVQDNYTGEAEPVSSDAGEENDPQTAPARRRMRFRFG